MKLNKLLALLLAVLLCLSIPTVAFADGEGPHFTALKATVEKEGGIPIYSYDYEDSGDEWLLKPKGITIPQGTELTLTGEFDEDGVLYFWLEYQDEYGYVRKDDVHLDLSEIAPADENAYAAPRHYVVVDPNGAEVHSGPGNSFEVVKTLPKGKEITVTHADDLSPDDGYSIWDYTPDARGWVQTGDDRGGEVAFAKSVKYRESTRTPLGTLKTREDTPFYANINDSWSEDGETQPLGTVPAGEELKFDLYFREFAYVTYQGKTGWLPLWKNVEAPVDGYLMTLESRPLYKEAAVNENTGTGKKIEAYQIVPYDLEVEISEQEGLEPGDGEFYSQPYDTWYRVTVDGAQYWTRFNSETSKQPLEFYSAVKRRVAETSNLLMYETPDIDSQRIGKIPGEEQLIELFDYYISEDETPELPDRERNWHYVAYGDLRGWSRYDYDQVEWVNDDMIYSLSSFLENPEKNEITEQLMPTTSKATAAETTVPNKTDGDGMAVKAPARTIILGCVAAAVILALVAGVTVALIKKRKQPAAEPAEKEEQQ
ncbi:MAG: hypothetical protein IK080_10815 [Clostridia bacterium]|nr:hypothetical protein [Clostridia bacterium]